jgi:hypothetical protein
MAYDGGPGRVLTRGAKQERDALILKDHRLVAAVSGRKELLCPAARAVPIARIWSWHGFRFRTIIRNDRRRSRWKTVKK